MAERYVEADGRRWRVYPSGFLTASPADEIGLFFVSGVGPGREVRVTRFRAAAGHARDAAIAALSEQRLRALFAMSQPSARSPEGGYRP